MIPNKSVLWEDIKVQKLKERSQSPKEVKKSSVTQYVSILWAVEVSYLSLNIRFIWELNKKAQKKNKEEEYFIEIKVEIQFSTFPLSFYWFHLPQEKEVCTNPIKLFSSTPLNSKLMNHNCATVIHFRTWLTLKICVLISYFGALDYIIAIHQPSAMCLCNIITKNFMMFLKLWWIK